MPNATRLAQAPRSRSIGRLLAVLATVVTIMATLLSPGTAEATSRSSAVVVANRGSGDISVIDTGSLDVTTVPLPGGGAEPMYVSHDTRHDRVLVGDRGSSTIVAFDDETYDVVGTIAVGDGIFHQWIDPRRKQLWVVGTTNSTVSVVDTDDLSLITTFALPADVIADGGVPHDVFVKGRYAYVSVLGISDGSGLVIQYSTRNFTEKGRIVSGGDPHLFVRGGSLYVASQEASSISRFHPVTLAPLGTESVPAAHGLFVSRRNEVFVTNITGGGVDALWELNRRLSRVVDVADTVPPVPHNLTVDGDRRLWVTHSGGTADQVSVVDLDRRGFGDSTTVTVGTNPFGLAFVR